MSTGGLLTPADTAQSLEGTAFVHLDGRLHGAYRTPDFAASLHLVDQVGRAAEKMNHHPDVQLGYGTAAFELQSHDAGGVTERDLRLAALIQEFAEENGAIAVHLPPARYDIAIDCTDADAVRPFWTAGMGYVESEGEDGIELVDPFGRAPRIWFQHMEIARTERNRIHIDVYVPTESAPQRVQDVIDAGGILVTDEHAPDWWVLADPEGNELCVCTSAE